MMAGADKDEIINDVVRQRWICSIRQLFDRVYSFQALDDIQMLVL
jgi:hypothetical protein